MKKKIGIIALALTSALLLTGCGGSGAKKDDAKTSAAKAAGLEVNLKKGYYALSDKKETSDDTAYIALEVNIKNTSDKKIFLSQENFAMYQKGDDEKIKPERTYDLQRLMIIKTPYLQSFQKVKVQQVHWCLK